LIHGVFDLHVHTIYSDGAFSPKKAVEVAKALGIGISITDHNEIRGSIKGFEAAKGEKFIFGIEVGTKEGKEILFYFDRAEVLEEFFKKEVEPYRTQRMTRVARSIERYIDEEMGQYDILFTTLPHPYGPFKKSVEYNRALSEKILDFVDAIEVYNSTQNSVANKKAVRLAKMNKKFGIAASDAHVAEDIAKGLSYIEVEGRTLTKTNVVRTDSFNIQSAIKTLGVIGYHNFHYSVLGGRYA